MSTWIIPLIVFIGTVIVTLCGVIHRSLLAKIDKIDNKDYITEDKVRQILEDKLTPLKDSLSDIKEVTDEIVDFLRPLKRP